MNVLRQIQVWGAVVILSGVVWGQSAADAIHILENETGAGARALAMGGAYAAVANDFTAAYWNPAGLGLLETNQFMAELSHLSLSNEARYVGTLTDDSQPYTRLRSLGVAYSLPTFQGSCVLAAGFNRISDYDGNLAFSGISTVSNGLGFDITVDDETDYYEFDTNVLRSERVDTEGGLKQWTFAGALALSPRLLAGVSLGIIDGTESYVLQFDQIDENDVYTQFPGDFDSYRLNQYLDSDVFSWDVKLGATVLLTDRFSLGAALTLPSRVTIKETHAWDDEIVFDNGDVSTDSDAGQWEYAITRPFVFDGGIAFNGNRLTLAASARYRDWSQVRFDVSDYQMDDADYRAYLAENSVIREDYQATVEYHLGGELRLAALGITLRGGYAYYPNPLETASDQDKTQYSGGVSFQIDRNLSFDLTGLRAEWNRESADDLTPAGTLEKITVNNIIAGFSYSF